jgi:hypothetical protein
VNAAGHDALLAKDEVGAPDLAIDAPFESSPDGASMLPVITMSAAITEPVFFPVFSCSSAMSASRSRDLQYSVRLHPNARLRKGGAAVGIDLIGAGCARSRRSRRRAQDGPAVRSRH